MQRKRIRSSYDLEMTSGGTVHLVVFNEDGRFQGQGAVRRADGSIVGQLLRSEAETEDQLISQMLIAASYAY